MKKSAKKNFSAKLYWLLIVVCLMNVWTPLAQAENYGVTQTFSADGSPHFPGVNGKTNRLYVSDVTAGTVTMFDATTGAKLAETATGAGAHTVMVDELNNLVYVTNRGANTLSVLDGKTNRKLADIPVGSLPHGLDLDLFNKRAYVSNTGGNNVTVVDLAKRKAIKTIACGLEPWGVVYDAVNKWIYTSNTGEGTVSRINPITGVTLAKISVGGRPWNVKVSPRTGRVYTTNETDGVLSVIQGNNVIAVLGVGPHPHGVTLNNIKDVAYVAVTGTNQVAVVDLMTNAINQLVPVGAGPTAIAWERSTGKVFVANQGGGTISVLMPQ